MTEEEIVSRIKSEITDSLGYGDEISKQRESAMEYYYGLPFGNEVEGRSQFVDSTVADTIEWIKPSLMRIFASGDEMVVFEPQGPEDVASAQQATDYVNYVFMRDNPGWEILYSWFTDALLQKNGIVKVWWDESDEWNREEYRNLTEDELALLLNDPNVEVVEHTAPGETFEDYGEQYSEGHHVVIKRDLSKGRIVVDPVPPDEFLIARESKSIDDSKFVCHRVRKTLSELREMFGDLDIEELGSDGDEDFSGERDARFDFDKSSTTSPWGFESSDQEDALRTYWLQEAYLRTDYDGDGIAELRKVCLVGTKGSSQ